MNRRIVTLSCLFALSLGFFATADDTATTEKKSDAVMPAKLVGDWVYESAVKNGEKKDGEALAGQSVSITEKTWTLNGDAKFVMDYKIDGDASPNTIKFTITESPFGGGMSTGGVIKMDGDMLVVCYNSAGGAAPKGFEAKEGSGNFLFRLKKK